MTRLSRSHPRYASLVVRARLADALRHGLVVPEGLIAHGRAEAFDYLLGERSSRSAMRAARMAAEYIARARHPVLSVNGNVAALAAPEVAELAVAWPGLFVEVNLFHRTPARARAVAQRLRAAGVRKVLGVRPTARLPGLPSDRARVDARGIARADVCVVPLEDGDRAEALRRQRVRVIAIDLNPLSRTAGAADIPIIDELTRALPTIARELRRLRRQPPGPGNFPAFDADGARADALRSIRRRLSRSGMVRPPRRARGRSGPRRSPGTGRRSRRTP
ncbi:MAG: phosphopantothenate/pantothenate synthetase [Thermoplasmata archaeon]|nr:phosphopantothenate/pantothenate synthetase [Thermoplasmata archaeon]